MGKNQLFLLFFIAFLMMLGFGIIIPILPYFAKNLGVNSFMLGTLFASYNIMQFLFSPLWGSLSDKIGRKPLIAFGLFGFSITFILFGMATSYTEMLVYRIIGGIVSAAGMPTVTAMVADLFPSKERAKGMGMIGAGVGLSFVFGPAIGGVLGNYGYSVPFFASGAVALLTFLLVLVALPESLPKEKRTGAISREKRGNPLGALFGSLSLLYFILFIASFAMAGLETTFALYIADLYGMSSLELGYMFLVMGFVGAFIQGGMLGKMVKKLGESKVLVAGLVLYAIGFLTIPLGSGFWTFAIILSLFGAGGGMIRATGTAMVTQRTTQGQGVTTGTISSMDSLGRILGPLTGGAVYAWQPNAPYLLGGVLMILLLLLYRVRSPYLPEPHPEPENEKSPQSA